MTEIDPWLRFLVAALATWRLTNLIAREDGPGAGLASLRARLDTGFFGQLMDCFYCLSLWVAAPVAWFGAGTWRDRLLVWFALSGAAILLDRFASEPVLIQPLNESTKTEL